MLVERVETRTLLRYVLRLTRNTCIANQILRPGTLIEVDEIDAEDLLSRKSAVRATEFETRDAPIVSAPRSRVTRNGASG